MSRRVVIVVAILLVLLVGGLVVLFIVADGEDALEAEKAKWEPLGGVPTLEELKPKPVSDDENAAILYMQAFEMMQPLLAQYRDEAWNIDDAICESDEFRDFMDHAWRATQMPECVWDAVYYAQGYTAQVPYLTDARELASLLAKAAECQIERGDVAAASRSVAAGMVLGRRVYTTDPALMSGMIGASIHTLMLDTLRSMFDEHEVPPGNAVERALAIIDYDDMLRRCLRGETALGYEGMKELAAGGFLSAIAILFVWPVDRDIAYYLSAMRGAIERFDLPVEERDWSRFTVTVPPRARLSTMLLPAIDTVLRRLLQTEVHVLFAREALKLRQHRAQHGEYPETWPMPSDPLTGESLHYQRDNGGFVLWRKEVPAEGLERLEWRWR